MKISNIKNIMDWITNKIFYLTPLALLVLLLAAAALGWVLYGLRGYKHWFKRFHRYQLPTRRQMRRNYGYVEYIPEVMNQPAPMPQARPAHVIHKHPPMMHSHQSAPRSSAPLYSTKDDLRVIEGIGPKIEEVLNENGIYTWRELSQTPVNNLLAILSQSGKKLALHDPTTWPNQAEMAHKGEWDELKSYQDTLLGGK